MSDPIRLMIVDDHAIVRDGLRWTLEAEPDVEVVAEACDGQQALERISASPTVVLTDLTMPVMDGQTLITRLAVEHPDVVVLLLTVVEDPAAIRAALQAGASGYLLKDSAPDRILSAVRRSARGELAVSDRIASVIAQQLARSDEDRLSDREIAVLQEVAEGATNAQAATRLHISESTVRTYLRRVFTKLGVQDRTSAAMVALSRGFIHPPRTDPS